MKYFVIDKFNHLEKIFITLIAIKDHSVSFNIF